jgi:hypothetical protein
MAAWLVAAIVVGWLHLPDERQDKTCAYSLVRSRNDSAYRAQAFSERAAEAPWEWPVAAFAQDVRSVIDASHWQRIVEGPLYGGDVCGEDSARMSAQLDEAAGAGGAVALGFRSTMHHSMRYGHMYQFVNAFYCGVVKPRLRREGLRQLRVYLPAGLVNCSKEYVSFLELFGTPRAQQLLAMTIERAPWVPTCVALVSECWAHGGVPAELRGKVTLLANVPNAPFDLSGGHQPGFRDAVFDCLDLLRTRFAPPSLILYVRSSRWQTGRRVGSEEAVVAALGRWAASEHPDLAFSAQFVDQLSFADEISLFASARVMISLWGASLHNCRFMRAGGVVVELYGAIDRKWSDTCVYTRVCASSCGLLHAPLGVNGTFPDVRRALVRREAPGQPGVKVSVPGPWRNHGYPNKTARVVASVEPDGLVAFMRRVFPADPCALPDWLGVFAEYNQFLGRQPDPQTFEPLRMLGDEFTKLPLLPQYRNPPWCHRR